MASQFLFTALALSLAGSSVLSMAASPSTQSKLVANSFSGLPLRFEMQADPKTPFVARTAACSVWITADGAVLRSRGADPIRIELQHANPAAAAEPLEEMTVRTNYFIGRDPQTWRRDVPNYARVRFRSVWPGIDVIYYGNGEHLEFDFVVSPGADPRAIALHIASKNRLRLDQNGDLLLGAGIRQRKPEMYQETSGGRQSIRGKYVLMAGNRVRFETGRYDHTLPLVIDPVLAYSTLFGGTLNETAVGIAADSAGNTYITGWTDSPDLPATAAGAKYMGTGAPDIFVAKIKPDASGVVYCSYIGGRDDDEPDGIALDASGNVYVTGYTLSSDFPTTAGALQTTYGGGRGDAFVFKLGPAGNALVYSTFLGSVGEDEGRAIVVDANGNAFVAGITSSSAFPTAGSPYQSRYRGGPFDGFVSKLNAAGTSLSYSTLLGSSGDDEPTALAIDSAGSAYVTGSTDAADFPTTNGALAQSPPNPFAASFVTKLNPIGSSLTYSTYLGGNLVDVALGIAVDSSGSAYVVGSTGSSAFPRTQGVLQSSFGGGLADGFVSKLKPDGTALVYSTYLGGSDDDLARAVAVDASGNAYVAGTTYSTNFPTTGGPFQAAIAGGSDAFVAKVNATGTALTYSSYLGGTQTERGNALALVSPSNLYVAGSTTSTNFRTTTTAMRKTGSMAEAYVAKVQEIALPSLAVDKPTLTFNFELAGAAPGPQTIQLTSTGGVLPFTATTTGGAWLAVGPGSGSTPASLSAFVNPAGLAAGSFTGNIVVTSAGADNSPLTVPVRLVVTQGAPAPTISAILPATVAAGGPDLTITVNGANFILASVVQVNGTPMATVFVNSTTLTAVIPAATYTKAGPLAITVANPAPNAVVTAPLTLTVTAPLPAVAAAGIVNAASLVAGGVAPGEVLTINGANIGPATALMGDGSSGAYATALGGVRVLFDEFPAPLLSVSAAQIVAVVPYGLDGRSATQFQVEYNGQKSAAVQIGVVTAAPAIFTLDSSGKGQGQVMNEDGSPNSKDNAATPGTLVTFSATGGGQTNPASVDGAVTSDTTPQLNQALAVQIGGVECADVTVTPAAGLISGMLTVMARIPADLAGTVPVVFTVGGVPSQDGVTLEVTPAAQ